MQACNKCPMPRRCVSSGRCIVYKEGAVAVSNPEPKPVPVMTSSGIKMTGPIKKAAPKKAIAKKKAK